MSADQPKQKSIDALPNDGKSRVVYRYGGLLRNHNNNSTNLLVEVLLIEIDMSNQWLHFDRCCTGLVPIIEIDSVQIGSIWIGDTLSKKNYNFNRKLVKRKFSFDLSAFKPKNIKLADKIPNTSEYYMSLKNYYLPNSNRVIDGVHRHPLTKYFQDSYQKVNHCLMISNDNIQVIAPSIHILHACFSNTKELRKHLLRKSPKKIIESYLDIYSSEEVNGNSKYTIKLKKTCDEKFGDTSIILLAYLALNKHVQSVVEKIQLSLENTDYQGYKSGRDVRHPIVFPPHPSKLNIEVEGIWIDDEHSRFIITRFIKVDPMLDHYIDVLPQDQLETTTSTEDTTHSSTEKSKNKNERMNTQQSPSRKSGVYRKQSDVEYGDSSDILNFIPPEASGNVREVDKHQHHTSDSTEDGVETSSDDPYGNKNNHIKKSKSNEAQKSRDNLLDFKNITKALSQLIRSESSPLTNTFSINKSGMEISGYNLLQIQDIVEESLHTYFIFKSKGRKLLFLRFEFRKNTKFCYFIDIHVNNSSESFYAYLFFTNQRLSESQITKICTIINNANGTKKWITQCDFISSAKAIKHTADTLDKWEKKFELLFKPFSDKADNLKSLDSAET